MCKGRRVELVCGHRLVWRDRFCCYCCEIPEGPVITIQDTCAQCHPSYRIKLLQQEFDRDVRALTQRIQGLKLHPDGKKQQLDKSEREMLDKHAAHQERISEARSIGRKCGEEEVVWPNKEEASLAVDFEWAELLVGTSYALRRYAC